MTIPNIFGYSFVPQKINLAFTAEVDEFYTAVVVVVAVAEIILSYRL